MSSSQINIYKLWHRIQEIENLILATESLKDRVDQYDALDVADNIIAIYETMESLYARCDEVIAIHQNLANRTEDIEMIDAKCDQLAKDVEDLYITVSDEIALLETKTTDEITTLNTELAALDTRTSDDLNALSTKTIADIAALDEKTSDGLLALETKVTDDIEALDTKTTDALTALSTKTTSELNLLSKTTIKLGEVGTVYAAGDKLWFNGVILICLVDDAELTSNINYDLFEIENFMIPVDDDSDVEIEYDDLDPHISTPIINGIYYFNSFIHYNVADDVELLLTASYTWVN